MGWLEFVASLIRSLAWPAMLGFVVWLLRKPIERFIDKLKRASGWGVSVETVDDLSEQTREAAEKLEADSESPSTSDDASSDIESPYDPFSTNALLKRIADRKRYLESWMSRNINYPPAGIVLKCHSTLLSCVDEIAEWANAELSQAGIISRRLSMLDRNAGLTNLTANIDDLKNIANHNPDSVSMRAAMNVYSATISAMQELPDLIGKLDSRGRDISG